jgi:hypothetical protein
MEMKFLIALLSLTVLTAGLDASALPLNRLFQDVKLPTQKVIEHLGPFTPIAQDTTYLLSNVAGPTSAAAATVSTFSNQPDYPRNLIMTAAGTSADLASCVVTVSGKNYNSHSISEAFTFASATLGAQTGSKAFKSVSSVSFPASCETGSFGVTWSLGVGVKFGLHRCMANTGDLIQDLLDGAKAGTAATMVKSTSAVESNTATFNTAPNGSHVYDVYFIQDNQCF